ncbi:MAG: hypothetical protein ACOY0S_01635 [Patescibacteria group bacterium]
MALAELGAARLAFLLLDLEEARKAIWETLDHVLVMFGSVETSYWEIMEKVVTLEETR